MRKPDRSTISKRALIARINRKLAHEGESLRESRTYTTDLGQFYIVDMRGNSIVNTHMDPVNLARELGVLAKREDA